MKRNLIIQLAIPIGLSVSLVLAGCDGSGPDVEGPSVTNQSVDFSTVEYWPSYFEDIHSSGNESFAVRMSAESDGRFQIETKSNRIAGTFIGMLSGDQYHLNNPERSDPWSTGRLASPGDSWTVNHDIGLTRPGEDVMVEGLVVTKLTVLEGGGLSLEVERVIELP